MNAMPSVRRIDELKRKTERKRNNIGSTSKQETNGERRSWNTDTSCGIVISHDGSL